jgi:hypothetical protein
MRTVRRRTATGRRREGAAFYHSCRVYQSTCKTPISGKHCLRRASGKIQMLGAFTGTASSITLQMEKTRRVSSPLYEGRTLTRGTICQKRSLVSAAQSRVIARLCLGKSQNYNDQDAIAKRSVFHSTDRHPFECRRCPLRRMSAERSASAVSVVMVLFASIPSKFGNVVSSDDLFLERFLLTEGAGWQQGQS